MRLSMFGLLTFALILLTSCTQEDVITEVLENERTSTQQIIEPSDQRGDVEGDELLRSGPCFSFLYPITVTLADRSTLTLNSDVDLRRLEVSRMGYVFNYPIGIMFPGRTTIRLGSDLDLRNAYAACAIRNNGPRGTRGGRGGGRGR